MSTDTRKTLFNPAVFEECKSRIEGLSADSKPEWGRMTAGQMMAHCAEIQEVINGKALKGTPWIVHLFKGVIRRGVLNDKPYPKSSKTHPQYVQRDDKDFTAEKQRLFDSLEKAIKMDPEVEAAVRHPIFGFLKRDEKGWGMYKHLDHHLRQFGV